MTKNGIAAKTALIMNGIAVPTIVPNKLTAPIMAHITNNAFNRNGN